MINFDHKKLELVHFLSEKQGYRKEKKLKDIRDNNAYLHNKGAEYNIVCISDRNISENDLSQDKSIKLIQEKLAKKSNRIRFNVLVFVFTENKSEIIKTENAQIVYMTSRTFEESVQKFFSDFKDGDPEKDNQEEVDAISGSSESVLVLKKQSLPKNLIVAWIFSILFFIGPILSGLIIPTLLKYQVNTMGMTGALSRDYLIGLNEWWRLFSYAFVSPQGMNLLSFSGIFYVIQCIILFFAIRYTEAYLKKWQLSIAIIAMIPMMGLLISIAMPTAIIYGMLPIIMGVCGLNMLITHGSKKMSTLYSRFFIKLTIFYLLLWALIGGQYINYLYFGLAFCIGGTFGFIFSYDWNNVDWTIMIPILVLTGIVITPIILIFINNYIPPINQDVFAFLHNCSKYHLLSDQEIRNLLVGYYHLSDSDITYYFGGGI